MQLVFATNNKGKLQEIQQLLKGTPLKILSLKDIDFEGDIPETGYTLEENSSQKALHIAEKYGCDCIADDSGLEVEALGGRPGVYSARYAGSRRSDSDNMQKVLAEMTGVENRRARFRTVISLIRNGVERQFEGIINGTIGEKPIGNMGFGYDPIFIPEGFQQTFAEMEMSEKNKISHRSKAIAQLVEHLRKLQYSS